MIEQPSVGRTCTGATGRVGRGRIQVAVRVRIVGRDVVVTLVSSVVKALSSTATGGVVAYSEGDIRRSGVAQQVCVADLIDEAVSAGEARVGM